MLLKSAIFLTALFLIPSNAISLEFLTLECLISEGLLKSEKRIQPKPESFPPVDPALQNTFVQSLKKIVSIEQLRINDQCHRSCAAFSFANYLDYLAPKDFGEYVSGAYFAARAFEQKFSNRILHGGGAIQIGNVNKDILEVFRVHGALTESQYPSRSDINTALLATILNNIAPRFDAAVSGTADMDQKDELTDDALILGSEVIQYFFGRYPREVFRNGKKTSAAEQRNIIVRAESPSPLRQHQVEFETLEKVAPFILENNLPIHLTYYAVGTHTGNGVYLPSPTLNTPSRMHAVILTGVFADRDGNRFYRVANSHANSSVLFFSREYLKANFIHAKVPVPGDLTNRFQELQN